MGEGGAGRVERVSVSVGQHDYWDHADYRADPLDYSYDLAPTSGYDPTFDDGSMPYTSPAGYFAPNAYGLYDMAGNVGSGVGIGMALTRAIRRRTRGALL